MTVPTAIVWDFLNFTNINLTVYQNRTNHTDYLTYHSRSPIWRLEYVFLVVMVTALAINGLIGNISVLIVYFRSREHLASNTFIKVLASVDLLVCSFVMPYTIIYELHLVTSDVICRFCELVLHFCIFASNITLVAVATERYIAVCQISSKVDTHTINVGIKVIIGLSIALGAPSIGAFAVVKSSDVENVKCLYPHEFTSGTFCHFTYSVMGQTLVTVYQGLSALLFYVTVIIIIVLYAIIYYVLWKKTKTRQKMLSRSPRNSSIESFSEISSSDHQRASKFAMRSQARRPKNSLPCKDIPGKVVKSVEHGTNPDTDKDIDDTVVECTNTIDINVSAENTNSVTDIADSRSPEQLPDKYFEKLRDKSVNNNVSRQMNSLPCKDIPGKVVKDVELGTNPDTDKDIDYTVVECTHTIDINIIAESTDSVTDIADSRSPVKLPDKNFEKLPDKSVNNNVTRPRKKIRFSVSVRSGRSEKAKRKKYYHRRTAKMLFLCTIIYFVTWLPFWIDVFGLTNCLVLRYLFFIGNSSNPLVYGIINQQVRRAFKSLFLGCVNNWFRVGSHNTPEYVMNTRSSASSF